jgi:phage-related protein
MKAIVWMGASRDALIGFPPGARRDAGYQLHRLQCGEEPSDWKPLISAGPGVREIRIWDDSGTFRVYLATRPEAIYVLHCFQKKTAKTSRREVELVRRRLKSIPDDRSDR